MSRPVIAVIGAAGVQGGGLARAILDDPAQRFALRALSGNTDAAVERALAAAGAEVGAADLDDEDSLVRAFAGAHGVFAVGRCADHRSQARRQAQAANIARAAQRAAVEHLIWSTTDDTQRLPAPDEGRRPARVGRHRIPHRGAGGEADSYLACLPVTVLRTSFCWDHLIHSGLGPRRNLDGELQFVLPLGAAKLPGIAAADIGACTLALFARGTAAIGKSVGIAGEHLSGAEMAAELGRALGEPVTYRAMLHADYARLELPGAEGLAALSECLRLFEAEYRASRPVDETRRLHPGLQSFRAWLERNVQKVPAAA